MSKTPPSFRVLGILQAMQLGVVLIVIFKLVKDYPANHWAFDLRIFYMVGLATILSSVIVLRRYGGRLGWYSLALGLVFSIFLAVIDFGNVLLDHKVWTERGQPAAFGPSVPKTP